MPGIGTGIFRQGKQVGRCLFAGLKAELLIEGIIGFLIKVRIKEAVRKKREGILPVAVYDGQGYCIP